MEENKGIAVPGEAEGAQANPTDFEAARDNAIKDKARKLGWKPKTEYDGDPAEWRPAKEFLERQSFFDKIKSVKDDLYHARKENKQLQKDLALIKEYVQKMSEIEYKRAVSDLQAQKSVAVANADVEAVKQIDAQIDTLKETKAEIKQEKAEPQGPPPEFNDWVTRNSWYQNDEELRNQADEFGLGIMNRNPGIPVAEVLRQVEAKVKKMFPEKFQTRRSAAPAVEAGGASGTTPRQRNRLSVGDLTDDQRKVMDTLVKRGVVTQDKYLDELSKSMGMK